VPPLPEPESTCMVPHRSGSETCCGLYRGTAPAVPLGVGCTGLVAACLLISKGAPETAVERLSAARGVTVPETAEQRDWIDRYAAIAAGAR
jgi:hypothetical protein